MATIVVLIDWRPRFTRGAPPVMSLLGLPVGPGTIAEYLRAELEAVEIDRWVVAPNGACGPDYVGALQTVSPETMVLDAGGFDAFLDAWEPADWLLFVDARRFPRGNLGALLALKAGHGNATALHLMHLQRSAAGTHERVLCDAQQRIRVIQRLYDGVTHVETVGVGCSLISVAMARHLQRADLFHLPRMRTRLAACGVPSHDCPATGATVDLLRSQDLLALNERLIQTATRAALLPRYTERAPGIWAGPRCRISPHSRIYAPAIIHDHVVIDAGAVVIGPTVLGQGAHIERRALVSQSLIGPRVRVGTATAVVRRVLVDSNGRDPLADEAAAAGARAIPSFIAEADSEDDPLPPPAVARRSLATMTKRAGDLLLTLLALTLVSPLLLLTAGLIKLTSRGPVLFRDEREGREGRVFRCWKFRTMVHGAHALQRALYEQNAVDGPQFKLDHDPRVTWLGGWLRRTNIDELPQLFNVLRGEMSLIGPRPSPFRENQICVPWREARLAVRPGITGLWQICRRERSAGDFHQWIYFDTLYVRHWSLGLDLRIFLATLLTLGGRWSVPLGWMIRDRHRQTPPAKRGFPAPAWPVMCVGEARAEASTSTVAIGVR